MSNRLKNTRIVSFKEDFKTKTGQVLYAKGSEHPIHKDLVERLKARGAKFDSKEFDMSKLEDAKKNFEENEDK